MRIQLITLLLFFSHFLFSQTISKIEPANWWIGMEHNTIQVLLYGEDIGHLNPKINYDKVALERTIKVENDNYLFLYLKIDDTAKAGTVNINLYDGDQLVTTQPFQLLDRVGDRRNIEGFNASDVMYLITPDRFANGNPDNDNVAGMLETANRNFKGGRHGGDIEGMQNSLDYIGDMGFTAIWINPVLENDMPDYSYHGYAATDFYKIDRRFGSNESYKNFCAAAKAKGIKIIMDMILNHSGSKHWFVIDPPTSDWINFQDNYIRTSHRRNTVQDIHASEYDKRAFSDGWFVETMPDLNQNNDLMADYLIQNTLWWIEYSGISGIRMDTYPYPDKNFMSDWTCAVMKEYPNFGIVGEEWTTNPAIVSYWQGGKNNHDGYTSCLPSLMDFPIQDALVRGLTREEKDYGSGLIETYEMLSMDFLYPDPDKLVIFPDNHDMDRFFTQINGDLDLYKMGIAYFSTMRGTPQIYYGTEILMENDAARNDHGIIRTDFPGGWQGDAVNAMTGKGLTDAQKEAQAYLKKLLNWRKNNKVIHNGKLIQFAPFDGIYVYFRYNDDGKVMVVLNKNATPTTVQLDRFNELLEGHQRGVDVVSGKSYSLEKEIIIPSKTALVLEVE